MIDTFIFYFNGFNLIKPVKIYYFSKLSGSF